MDVNVCSPLLRFPGWCGIAFYVAKLIGKGRKGNRTERMCDHGKHVSIQAILLLKDGSLTSILGMMPWMRQANQCYIFNNATHNFRLIRIE